MQARQAEQRAGDAGVEILMAEGEFQPVVEAHGHARGGQAMVPGFGAAQVGRDAYFTLGGLAADHGPRADAATGRAFHCAHAAGEQQLAGVGQGRHGGEQGCRSGQGQQGGRWGLAATGLGEVIHGVVHRWVGVRWLLRGAVASAASAQLAHPLRNAARRGFSGLNHLKKLVGF
ncbi:hypothetical protein FQZ97_1022830 [compost metagenome]